MNPSRAYHDQSPCHRWEKRQTSWRAKTSMVWELEKRSREKQIDGEDYGCCWLCWSNTVGPD